MNFKICIVSYLTGKYDYYDIYDLNSYMESLRNFNDRFNKHDGDYEIQIMESDISNIDEEDLYNFFKFIDEREEYEIEELLLLLECMSFSEAKECIDDDTPIYTVYSSNKLSAFIQYYEDLGYEMPSDNFRNYIDWESLMSDFESNGLSIYDVGYSDKFIIVRGFKESLRKFIFVREY